MTKLKNWLKNVAKWFKEHCIFIFIAFWLGDIISCLYKMAVNGATIDAVTKKLYWINISIDWIYCCLFLFTWYLIKAIGVIRQREDTLIDFIIKVLALSKDIESENKAEESTDKKEDLNEEKQ